MSKDLSAFVEAQLQKAADQGRCLRTHDPKLNAALLRRVDLGMVYRPIRCYYMSTSLASKLTPIERYLYLLRVVDHEHDGCIFSHVSAAVLHGLSVSYSDLRAVHIATTLHAHSGNWSDIQRHVVMDDEAVVFGGLKATSFERTVFDCMRSLSFSHALAIGDSALRKGASKEALESYLETKRRYRGIVQARAVMSLSDGRAENGGESIARAAMIELGFMVPDLQVPMTDPVSMKEYRVDFLWTLPNGDQIIGELDGGDKYVNPEMTGGRDVVEVMKDERQRESRLTIGQTAVCRFSPRDVRDRERFASILSSFGVPRVVP